MANAPRLTRTTARPAHGIVHFGPGAFFRAFNAIYAHETLQTEGGDWGIVAISLKSATARDQLAPQECVYHAVALGPNTRDAQLITSISDILVAPENPAAVLDVLASSATRIVSLTITEKGYCHNPANGQLDLEHPDIRHDLKGLSLPRTAIGFLVGALARRRGEGTPPFTVLSCDNLPSNGMVTRALVLEFAQIYDPTLADWIAEHVPFPSTMIDRITPATTEADLAQLEAELGLTDTAAVVHEPFRQWVIEDDFAQGRPHWEAQGVTFVENVSAHELMKLRCLNGTHSTLSYLGFLAGYKTISDTVADPHFARLCQHLWTHEIIPTLSVPDGENLSDYCAALLERYRNPAVRHLTWQIAMDGSQKLPQRILGTVRDRLSAGAVPHGLCLAVAGWMRYVGGFDEKGDLIDVRDPLADQLRASVTDGRDAEEKVMAVLSLREVFGTDLVAHPQFCDAVIKAYEALSRNGSKAVLRDFVAASHN